MLWLGKNSRKGGRWVPTIRGAVMHPLIAFVIAFFVSIVVSSVYGYFGCDACWYFVCISDAVFVATFVLIWYLLVIRLTKVRNQ
jgi:hypothetical protein